MLLVGIKLAEDRLKGTFIGWSLSVLGQTALFFFVIHMLFYKGLSVLLGGSALIPGNVLVGLYVETALTMIPLVVFCALYRNLRRKYSVLSYL